MERSLYYYITTPERTMYKNRPTIALNRSCC